MRAMAAMREGADGPPPWGNRERERANRKIAENSKRRAHGTGIAQQSRGMMGHRHRVTEQYLSTHTSHISNNSPNANSSPPTSSLEAPASQMLQQNWGDPLPFPLLSSLADVAHQRCRGDAHLRVRPLSVANLPVCLHACPLHACILRFLCAWLATSSAPTYAHALFVELSMRCPDSPSTHRITCCSSSRYRPNQVCEQPALQLLADMSLRE